MAYDFSEFYDIPPLIYGNISKVKPQPQIFAKFIRQQTRYN